MPVNRGHNRPGYVNGKAVNQNGHVSLYDDWREEKDHHKEGIAGDVRSVMRAVMQGASSGMFFAQRNIQRWMVAIAVMSFILGMLVNDKIKNGTCSNPAHYSQFNRAEAEYQYGSSPHSKSTHYTPQNELKVNYHDNSLPRTEHGVDPSVGLESDRTNVQSDDEDDVNLETLPLQRGQDLL